MANKRITAWGVLLTAVLCTAGLSASVGESQARYVNQVAWHTVAEPAVTRITGNGLADSTQPRLINLLGELSQPMQVPITLTSDKNLSGALIWTVSESQYIKVSMGIGSRPLENGDVIGLSAGKPASVTMTIEPTGQEIFPATTVDIQVTWRETLTATYRVNLFAEEQPEAIDPSPGVELKTVEAFSPDSAFPLTLTADRGAQVQLGINGDGPFPEGTRYSPDQGNTWYRLGCEGKIPVDIPENGSASLLLDLSETELTQSVTLCAGDAQATLTADPTPIYRLSGRVLTLEQSIRIQLTNAWPSADFGCRAELLTAAEGKTAYVPVELSADGLSVNYTLEETGPVLTLSAGNTLPQPGTYRLRLSWSRDGLCFQQSEITFFVNYTQQTGGAQP